MEKDVIIQMYVCICLSSNEPTYLHSSKHTVSKEFVSLNVNNQLKNEDTIFLQNLEENPKETGLPEYIMEIIQS